ncbi:MerR family transcriptional regulator [Streptomyces argyrophylli]|uniref:MerR family transcriptional regulator n=1 Tax=Streptomyces argyrophylli TaxID=2726118 RepID=A0A6M4PDS6_9ACTN|nr:MerR family transcriptional regulator [Streptomyces argyrophyllae]QJS08807.1 MerR family transcriptional regulator [Streptomyces argyrophyllae]
MAGSTDRAAGLTIQEMARRSGFTEPTLRYYEKIGLLGRVARDESSGHRRYDPATADRVEALACLRSAGMTVSGMRRYLDLLARGDSAAAEQRDLFAVQAEKLAADIERLRLRLAYLRGKADLWDARVRGDTDAEKRAIDDVTRVMNQFTD